MFLISSCAEPNNSKPKNISYGNNRETEVEKINYKDHDYIFFGAGSATSVVHDPDCSNLKCRR